MNATENFLKLLLETFKTEVKLATLLLKTFQGGQELQQIWQGDRTLANSKNQKDEKTTCQMDETKQEVIDLGDGQIDKDIKSDYPTTSNPSDEYSNGKYDVKLEIEDKPNYDDEMKCRNCGKSYRYRGSYEKHLYYSGKHLKTIIALNEHKLVQAGFKNKALLKVRHQIHEEPRVECDICGKRLKTRQTWNMHKMLHK